jgi:hypothetical protein
MDDCFPAYELLHCITLLDTLKRYMEAARNDPCLGPAHMSLYTALLLSEETPGRVFVLRRRYLMRLSKIRSRSTYYQCMKDLNVSGFVYYYPSLDPTGDSRVLVRYIV